MTDDGYISRRIFDARLSLSPGGPYISKKDGQEHIGKPRITIKTLEGKEPIEVSARALLALFFLMQDDNEVRDELRKRAALEKATEREF